MCSKKDKYLIKKIVAYGKKNLQKYNSSILK